MWGELIESVSAFNIEQLQALLYLVAFVAAVIAYCLWCNRMMEREEKEARL